MAIHAPGPDAASDDCALPLSPLVLAGLFAAAGYTIGTAVRP